VIADQAMTVVEGNPNGSAVGNVVASDPDAGQVLTYAITGGNAGNTFDINSATGQITVADNTNLFIATHPAFALTVQVTDNGFPALSRSATVTITLTMNHPPTIANQTFSVPAGSPNATPVGMVVASDPDAGQSLTFAIVPGTNSSVFSIDPVSGQITVANTTGLTTDNSPFTLTVKVTDNDKIPLSSTATITINAT
jgi:hypothetical protein